MAISPYFNLIKKYFPQEEWENALRVMMGESGGRPGAIGDNYPIRGQTIPSYGLFQIRGLPGRPPKEQLLDPEFNVKYAAQMQQQQGWSPWTVARNLGIVGGQKKSIEAPKAPGGKLIMASPGDSGGGLPAMEAGIGGLTSGLGVDKEKLFKFATMAISMGHSTSDVDKFVKNLKDEAEKEWEKAEKEAKELAEEAEEYGAIKGLLEKGVPIGEIPSGDAKLKAYEEYVGEAGYTEKEEKENKKSYGQLTLGLDRIYDLYLKVPKEKEFRALPSSIKRKRSPEYARFITERNTVGYQIVKLYEEGRISDQDRKFWLSLLPDADILTTEEAAKESIGGIKTGLRTRLGIIEPEEIGKAPTGPIQEAIPTGTVEGGAIPERRQWWQEEGVHPLIQQLARAQDFMTRKKGALPVIGGVAGSLVAPVVGAGAGTYLGTRAKQMLERPGAQAAIPTEKETKEAVLAGGAAALFDLLFLRKDKAVKARQFFAEKATKKVSGDVLAKAGKEAAKAATGTDVATVIKGATADAKRFSGKEITVKEAVRLLDSANKAFTQAGRVGKSAKSLYNSFLSRALRAEIGKASPATLTAQKAIGISKGAGKWLRRLLWPAAILGGGYQVRKGVEGLLGGE